MKEELLVKFIVSEDIEGQPINNTLARNIIINPILVMRSQFIPSSLSLGVTIIVNGIDFRESHNVQIKLVNTSLKKAIYDTGITYMNANETQSVDNFSFNLQLRNIPFENEGVYEIVFTIDELEFTDSFKVLKVGS